MILIDFLRSRYEYGEGENGARTVRRKTARTVGIFGGGTTSTEEPFKRFSEALVDVWRHCLDECGPCTRAQVVATMHQAADQQDRAAAFERKNKRK